MEIYGFMAGKPMPESARVNAEETCRRERRSCCACRRIHAGIPWKMSASPCSVSKVAPLLGEDTEAVLTSLLKLSNEQIQDLRRRGIIV
jgi:crotonobetainyl-CoA:carnitine CoA-transferase CaiB-like acyl-CoA transferase